jgi:hypothetical protein
MISFFSIDVVILGLRPVLRLEVCRLHDETDQPTSRPRLQGESGDEESTLKP